MSCAQAHWVGSKPIRRVMQLELHKPTMAIGSSLRICAQNVDSTNPGRSNHVFSSKPIPEAEMSNRLIVRTTLLHIHESECWTARKHDEKGIPKAGMYWLRKIAEVSRL